jgi:transposase
MQIENIEDGLDLLLNISKPWKLQGVDLQHKNKVVEIEIGFIRGATFKCNLCDADCKVHDSNFHRIRHLDIFEYRCYLSINVPRIKCLEHGVKVIEHLPWGYTGSHYSFFLKKK